MYSMCVKHVLQICRLPRAKIFLYLKADTLPGPLPHHTAPQIHELPPLLTPGPQIHLSAPVPPHPQVRHVVQHLPERRCLQSTQPGPVPSGPRMPGPPTCFAQPPSPRNVQVSAVHSCPPMPFPVLLGMRMSPFQKRRLHTLVPEVRTDEPPEPSTDHGALAVGPCGRPVPAPQSPWAQVLALGAGVPAHVLPRLMPQPQPQGLWGKRPPYRGRPPGMRHREPRAPARSPGPQRTPLLP